MKIWTSTNISKSINKMNFGLRFSILLFLPLSLLKTTDVRLIQCIFLKYFEF